MHGKGLREPDACAGFGVQQREKRRLLRVVRAGGVARGGPDAAVLLEDQLLAGQMLVRAETPRDPRLLVKILGKGLGQAVGERLGHDRGVIVVFLLVTARQLVAAVDAEGEAAKVIGPGRSDVIRERMIDAGRAAFASAGAGNGTSPAGRRASRR